MKLRGKIYFLDGKWYRYKYRVVISCGCGILAGDYLRMKDAKNSLPQIQEHYPNAEIERVREILNGDRVYARQYDLQRGGKWVSSSECLQNEPE